MDTSKSSCRTVAEKKENGKAQAPVTGAGRKNAIAEDTISRVHPYFRPAIFALTFNTIKDNCDEKN
jgi:hypothetical protein